MLLIAKFSRTLKEYLILQESAGIFAYIKEHIMSVAGNQTLTSDLSPEVLNGFRCIMVAQAQDCFYDKANTDPSCE